MAGSDSSPVSSSESSGPSRGQLVLAVVAGAAVAGVVTYVLARGEERREGGVERASRLRDTKHGDHVSVETSGNVGQQALDAVGGHGSKKNKGPPILVRGQCILKPFQPAQPGKKKSRGELEAEFYKRVTEEKNPIAEFIPKYYGTEVVDGVTYLKIENLTFEMKCPCILDLKMGRQTYDETASPEKRAHEIAKYPPQAVIGFRIVGMKVFRKSTGELWKSTRQWCMEISQEAMPKAIEQFFFDGRTLRFPLIEQMTAGLKRIEDMLREHPQWRMYGSSLLAVYDGIKEKPELRLRMIDFAHIFPIEDGGVDDGYLHGLRFLRTSLENTLANVSGPSQVGGAHGNIALRDGVIVKKEDKKEQFDIEVAFYKKVWDPKHPDSLRRVMPKLIQVNGTVSPRELVISDASTLVRNPAASSVNQPVSIMDIKLGIRSFRADCPNDPKPAYYNKYATFEKELSPGRAEEIWAAVCGDPKGPPCLIDGKLGKRDYLSFRDATTTSRELGFRLTALVHGDYKVTQHDARVVESKMQFLERLEHFLYNEKGFDLEVALKFIHELEEVHRAIAESKVFKNYELVGTSLLFLHCNGSATIRLIDFANSSPAQVADHNGIVDGVRRLSLAIEELCMKYK